MSLKMISGTFSRDRNCVTLRAGEIIAQYSTHDLLGEGSYGRVFKGFIREAQNSNNWKQVAIKVCRQKYFDLQEAEYLSEFIHVYDPVIVGNEVFLIQSFLSGKELYQDKNKMDIHARLSAITQLCMQVHVMHSYRPVPGKSSRSPFMHSDIKGENINIHYKDGLPIVTSIDYGLSHEKEGKYKRDGRLLKGNAVYFAPETLKGRYYFSTDVYMLAEPILYLLGNPKLTHIKRNQQYENDPSKALKRVNQVTESTIDSLQLVQQLHFFNNFNLDYLVRHFLKKMLDPNHKHRPNMTRVFIFFNNLRMLCLSAAEESDNSYEQACQSRLNNMLAQLDKSEQQIFKNRYNYNTKQPFCGFFNNKVPSVPQLSMKLKQQNNRQVSIEAPSIEDYFGVYSGIFNQRTLSTLEKTTKQYGENSYFYQLIVIMMKNAIKILYDISRLAAPEHHNLLNNLIWLIKHKEKKILENREETVDLLKMLKELSSELKTHVELYSTKTEPDDSFLAILAFFCEPFFTHEGCKTKQCKQTAILFYNCILNSLIKLKAYKSVDLLQQELETAVHSYKNVLSLLKKVEGYENVNQTRAKCKTAVLIYRILHDITLECVPTTGEGNNCELSSMFDRIKSTKKNSSAHEDVYHVWTDIFTELKNNTKTLEKKSKIIMWSVELMPLLANPQTSPYT